MSFNKTHETKRREAFESENEEAELSFGASWTNEWNGVDFRIKSQPQIYHQNQQAAWITC